MTTYLKSIHRAFAITMAMTILAMTAGCSDSSDTPSADDTPTGTPTAGVPITIALGGYSTDDSATRTPPPGAGTATSGSSTTSDDNGYEESKAINAVRIIAFRRKAGSNTSFVYDEANDHTLTELTDEDGHTDDYLSGKSHKHRVARGTFAKSYGYEYRIVAVAYDSNEQVPYPELTDNKVAEHYMKINVSTGTTYDDFCATFESDKVEDTEDKTGNWGSYLTGGSLFKHDQNINSYLTIIPQLFYGHIYEKGDNTMNPVIPYSTYDSNGTEITDTPLTGTLYRGMAEVEINISNINKISLYNPYWACLLADNVLTGVKLTDYDDFNHCYAPVSDDNKYTAVAYQNDISTGKSATLRAYLLPGKTRLALRLAVTDGMAVRGVHNGQIQAADVTSADNATGVITVDAVNNVFYLRRNHKYVFNCQNSSTIMNHSFD